jgi:hypothetical protein
MMKRTYQIGTVAILTLGVLAFQNCGKATMSTPRLKPPFSKVTSSDIDNHYRDLRLMTSQNVMCSTDADCTAIGLGVRECGGPTEYAVTSQSADMNQIDKLNQELIEMQTIYYGNAGMVGTCDFKEAPDVACVAKVCVAR